MTIHAPPTSRSRRQASARSPCTLAAIALALAPLASLAADDLPPALVARFTRNVQPLLLNKCAAGACHGGQTAHEPRLEQADVRGGINRPGTLANIETLLDLLGPECDPQPLVRLLSARHPAHAASRNLVMSPLTPQERTTLENWIAGVRLAKGQRTIRDPAVQQAAHEPPAEAAAAPPGEASRPNRFRALLDSAANPPALPPPQEPQGLILGKDEPPTDADE
jgi:hypothetical protein